jgi:hypothetical protein
VQVSHFSGLAVGRFPPEATMLEHHFLAVDVIAKPETAQSQAPLALAEGGTATSFLMWCMRL